MRKYLKKCKSVLGSSKESKCCSSSELENCIQQGVINEINDEFEGLGVVTELEEVKLAVANVIQLKGPGEDKNSLSIEDSFQSALSSISDETVKSEESDFFSLDSRQYDETEIKFKQNVLESFECRRTLTEGDSECVSEKVGVSPFLDVRQEVADDESVVRNEENTQTVHRVSWKS